jgi:LDH2 family malate/lactate/ureidoglycolate dehydrogenase
MRIDAFQEPSVFKANMDKWIATFRNAKPASGREGVLIPGDPEREKEIKLRAEGIPVLPAIVKDLKEIGEEMGIEFNSRD